MHTKSMCSKNKTNKPEFQKTLWIFTTNQCDFCCWLSETISEMCSCILASVTLRSFSQQSLFLFFVFVSTILEKECSQRYRYVVINDISISRTFLVLRGYAAIWWHQNVESVVVLKSYRWTWLCCCWMISPRYLSLTSAVATLNVQTISAWWPSRAWCHESYEWGDPNHRTPETDSPNTWGSIEPSLRTSAIVP